MKPRFVLALASTTAVLGAAGAAVRLASTDRPSPLTAEYTQTALRDGGLLGTFTVSNTSDWVVADWSIEFEFPRNTRLAGVWNGELFESKSTYVIKPTAQTRSVGAHRSVRVGLSMFPGSVIPGRASPGDPVGGRGGSAGTDTVSRSPIVPRNCTINGRTCRIVIAKAALASAPAQGLGIAPSDGSGRPLR